MKTAVSIVGWAAVIIGLDLSIMVFAFCMSIVDAAFGDHQGAQFWIGFLSSWPTPLKYLP